MAAFLNADVDPDRHDGFHNGIHGLLDDGPRPADVWGTIAAWAWGCKPGFDYLETVPEINSRQVAVIGHSRGGKTALWAAAEDQRFAMAVSNDSGCGGASLSRRRFAGREQVARIVNSFPHWFCSKFASFADHEDELPVDQHELIALTSRHAVAVGSAAEDRWADPARRIPERRSCRAGFRALWPATRPPPACRLSAASSMAMRPTITSAAASTISRSKTGNTTGTSPIVRSAGLPAPEPACSMLSFEPHFRMLLARGSEITAISARRGGTTRL